MDTSKYVPRVTGHALVLGGSGDLGIEVVRALVAFGAKAVSFTYSSNKKAADGLMAELIASGVKAYCGSPVFTDENSMRDFLEAAVQHAGEEITAAVNTVSISPNVPFEAQTLDGRQGWRNVFEVNLSGVFVSMRAIGERMKSKGLKGSIVLITSDNGMVAYDPISAPYDISKAGQIHMVKIFAVHYAPAGIRVVGVAPGWIETKMNDTLPPDYRKEEEASILRGKFAEPHEIATVVAFAASSGAANIVGENIVANGGYR